MKSTYAEQHIAHGIPRSDALRTWSAPLPLWCSAFTHTALFCVSPNKEQLAMDEPLVVSIGAAMELNRNWLIANVSPMANSELLIDALRFESA